VVEVRFMKTSQIRPPEWRSGLRKLLYYRSWFDTAAGCNREAHEEMHNWPSVVQVSGGIGRPQCLLKELNSYMIINQFSYYTLPIYKNL
jgi:hypothetical protein